MDAQIPANQLIPTIKALCIAGQYDDAISLTSKIPDKVIAIKAHLLCAEHEYRRFLDGLAAEKNQALSDDQLNERIFSGCYPAGIVYADRHVESGGDYKRLAFLDFATLTLSIEKDCPSQLAAYIKKDAANLQSKSGMSYRISTSGQSILLGHANATD